MRARKSKDKIGTHLLGFTHGNAVIESSYSGADNKCARARMHVRESGNGLISVKYAQSTPCKESPKN